MAKKTKDPQRRRLELLVRCAKHLTNEIDQQRDKARLQLKNATAAILRPLRELSRRVNAIAAANPESRESGVELVRRSEDVFRRFSRNFASEIANIREAQQKIYALRLAPTFSQLVHELIALGRDYEVSFVTTDRTLIVSFAHEDRIVLADADGVEIDFGPFSVEMRVRKLIAAQLEAITVRACDPNPSAADDAYTHPHLNHGDLCLGEVELTARDACRVARIGDVVDMYFSVLRNYNADSVYCSIGEWTSDPGVPCRDCDARVHDDEGSACDRCEATLCENCGTCCANCDALCCNQCNEPCANCERSVCSACDVVIGDPGSGEYGCRRCADSCANCGLFEYKTELNDDAWCRSCLADNEARIAAEEAANAEDAAEEPGEDPETDDVTEPATQEVATVLANVVQSELGDESLRPPTGVFNPRAPERETNHVQEEETEEAENASATDPGSADSDNELVAAASPASTILSDQPPDINRVLDDIFADL